ncbi:MAG: HAMP domain-containing histidine kinase [Lachnospiraceae bacterium]|nr:HAMP domain-containing histidine kinase [Lachnospiraceae bacterium]MBO6297781.1 HAMP domain-containing histidine kinase [Lachnospiraceae bacterium]MBP3296133.1 HAMP domain-containing histidine kinase [Lachnospiraceae bacterium]
MKRFTILRSFRLRIFIIILLVGLLTAEVMRYAQLSNYRSQLVSEKTMEVMEAARITANKLINYNYLQNPSSELIESQLQQLSMIFEGRIIVIDENFRVLADTYDISVGRTMIGEEVIRCYQGMTITNYDPGSRYIEVVVPIVPPAKTDEEVQTEGVLLISASTADIVRNAADIGRRAVIIEIVFMMLVVGIAAIVAGVIVRPFDRVTKAIGSVVTFDDETPVVSDYKETQEIVEAFNKLRQRLKVLDDSRQEFVSNVSHELKTPIASIKVLADSLNVQEEVPVEVYKDFMQDISVEIDRENEIITDLLNLVRMEKGASDLRIENRSINELLEQIIKRLGPLARKNEVDLILESHRPVSADIDEVKFTQAITNIIENGIKYNKHPGWVKIVLDADHQYMTIDISDSGVGIPEAEQGHIYERFYRGDKSHSKEISGTGLGLSLTRKSILLHRGSIEVKSVVGEGTDFIVKIPLSYIQEQEKK